MGSLKALATQKTGKIEERAKLEKYRIMCRKAKKFTFELGCSTQNWVLFVVK